MKRFRVKLRRYVNGPMVRPLALAGPILILIIALPLLRPIRHPSANQISNDELLRIATIRSLVERGTLALDKSLVMTSGAVRTDRGVFSAQPPTMSVLLAGPAWIMTRFGLKFDDDLPLITYVLTVLGVTLPAAGAAGLVYRMGRLFELHRRWRTMLGICVVLGSGLLSYAVVLNPYAPAATLLLAAAACIIHVASIDRDRHRASWFILAGASASLATMLDPAALVMFVLMALVIVALRMTPMRRVGGIMLFLFGATPPLALHAAYNVPITGDLVPASIHVLWSNRPAAGAAAAGSGGLVAPNGAGDEFDDDFTAAAGESVWASIGATAVWFINATVGDHGLFSHFPVMVIGVLGIGAVMHRHWPGAIKTLAAASGIGALLIILGYRLTRLDWSAAMFASKWFVVFSPLLLFWAGAWMRRGHDKFAWALACTAMLLSAGIGLIGATDPMPRHGYEHYTASDALVRLVNARADTPGNAVAGRTP